MEAGSAEDGPSPFRFRTGFEGDLAGIATLSADGVVEGSVPLGGLACRATGLAPLWGLEVPLRVELLFPVSKGERCAAVAARKLLISHTKIEKKKIKDARLLSSCFLV